MATQLTPPALPPRLELILETLVRDSVLTAGDIERAGRVAQRTGERLDKVLPKLGMVEDHRLAAAMAKVLDLPHRRREEFPDHPIEADKALAAFLHKHLILPLELSAEVVRVAVTDPLDEFAVQALGFRLDREVRIEVATPADVEFGLSRLYPLAAGERVSRKTAPAAANDDLDLERLQDQASDAPVIQWVNALIADAVEANASDIHFEPQERGLRVRQRIDGALQEITAPPTGIAVAAASRIKVMAKLDIAERRLPQDGRCSVTVRGRDIDLRVATAPSLRGETVVLRILDKARSPLDLDKLGYSKPAAGRIRELMAEPHGIILVTGPTGSGKTTTLYAALTELTAPDRKIMSVEDPVEYELEGVSQIQIKPGIDLTFARTLRSILRHDPDIIMVGEIRDADTAEIAIEAALTGHLVLSTLHTNSAAAALTRLQEMGLPGYLLAATLRGIVAQRLVRRLCEACRRPSDQGSRLAAKLGGMSEHGTVFGPVGCPACGQSGYRGRSCIAEVLPITSELRDLMLEGAAEATLERRAVETGMVRLVDDGIAKANAGITSMEEVLKAAGTR